MSELIIGELDSLIVETHDQTVVASTVVECSVASCRIGEVNRDQCGRGVGIRYLMGLEDEDRAHQPLFKG